MQRALVYTRTTRYRHDSIPAGIAALRELGRDAGLAVDATEEPEAFTPENLGGYQVVVFLSTSGEVLTDGGRAAFSEWVRAGGGFVGVHLAAGTEPDWGFFGELVGARFTRHPHFQPAVVTVEDQRHPATSHLPAQWMFDDEWYEFDANPRGMARVLASVDERCYEGGTSGLDHPLAWCHEHCGGRSFYTALGHAEAAYADHRFRAHLEGALTWAARLD
ncbi:MAG TPA: ThuA domain-containing protein [Actinocrinis sp.]|uniref:ThuA domain-containing protein n=1 Tax=Actinocrinis sp. TaxID=1920516 RepID=UPI002DDD1EC1|nr:ThuA domain-containing protein [Actinocrinis sp.]HEV2346307.1 ThuA domain-containing protein [Actinocrinis sp.]